MCSRHLKQVGTILGRSPPPRPNLDLTKTSDWTRRSSGTSHKNMEVLVESRDGKSLITLNRPEVLNTLSISLGKELMEVMKDCQATQSMIVIRGQGDKAFCAGGEVLPRSGPMPDLSVPWEGFRYLHTVCSIVHHLQIPYIVLLNGITMGGGLALGILGRYRVATEKTLCAMPETLIGYYPNSGGAYFLPKLRKGAAFGLFMGLTGHRFKGSDNLHAGIATHMCQSTKLNDLQEELLSVDEPSFEKIEKILQEYTENCPESKNRFSLEGNLRQIEDHFGRNSVEEIMASLEKDSSEWALSVKETLKKMSPTSLKITFEHFKRNGRLSLNECLAVDVGLSHRCIQGPDFMEGVRALLIAKGGKPEWDPQNLTEVSDSYINSFFEPLPRNQQLNYLDSKL